MNRRLFLRALGIGVISAPVVATLFNEPAPVDPAPRLANGGIIRDGGPYLVGERGPDVTINASTVDPNAIVKALREYERRNGQGWRA